jgi:hypothetical protein
MDDLLHALENVVESLDNPAYEVEYHVGYGPSRNEPIRSDTPPERCPDPPTGRQRHLCNK